jgi:hypothetical protein
MDQPRLVSTHDAGGWAGLLKRATVMLTAPAGGPKSLGTGFVIAPGIVATCAHFLATSRDELPPRVEGLLAGVEDGALVLETDPAWYFRTGADGVDVALLRIVSGGHGLRAAAPVLLSPVLTIGDGLWTYGHPAKARAGQAATFDYQGDTRKDVGGTLELPRGYGVPVGPGYSGSAVVNTRTGAVCGMLVTSDSAGSAHMIPVAELLSRCPQARRHDTVAAHRTWLAGLSDAQLTAGGWLYPGARLRAYLHAAAAVAADHPYFGVASVIGPPPLSQVYVRSDALVHPWCRRPAPRGGAARRSRLPAWPQPAGGNGVRFRRRRPLPRQSGTESERTGNLTRSPADDRTGRRPHPR